MTPPIQDDRADARIASRTLSDQVHDVLLGRLIAREIGPGEFLREEEISRELDVSRTPVREAMARLASSGFLERLPHRGYRAPEHDPGALGETYPIIATLEVLTGRLAFPRMGPADFEALRGLNRRLAEEVAKERAPYAVALNDAFHEYIAGLAGNRRLAALLMELRAPLRRLELWFYSSRENGERSVREHSEMLDALQRGDLDGAMAILERNMALTQRVLSERA
jgi:DNA-binding GntR family transcriptional regulator